MCYMCRETKSFAAFSNNKTTKDGKQKYCKACASESLKKYRLRNGDSYGRKSRLRLKIEVLTHYSPDGLRCACCGESNHEFLAIDHIRGGGNQHRKQVRSTIYNWLKRSNFPVGYRVLCHNCNFSLGLLGYCPHQHGGKRRLLEKPLSECLREQIIATAQQLADEGVYPSMQRVAKAASLSMGTVQRHKTAIMKQGNWPMQKEAEERQRRYRPDLYAS